MNVRVLVFARLPIDTSRNKHDEAQLRPGPHVTFKCAEIDKLEQRDKWATLFWAVSLYLRSGFIANLETASREASLYGSFPI